MMKKHRRFLVALIKTLTATNQSNPMNLNSLTMNVHVSKFSFHSKFLLLGQRCPTSQRLTFTQRHSFSYWKTKTLQAKTIWKCPSHKLEHKTSTSPNTQKSSWNFRSFHCTTILLKDGQKFSFFHFPLKNFSKQIE